GFSCGSIVVLVIMPSSDENVTGYKDISNGKSPNTTLELNRFISTISHYPPFPFYVFVNVFFPVIRNQKTCTPRQPSCDILLHLLNKRDFGGQDNCMAPLDRIFYSCGKDRKST